MSKKTSGTTQNNHTAYSPATALSTVGHQGGSFELSRTSPAARSEYQDEGFALWMLNPTLWLPRTFGGFLHFLVFIAVLAVGSLVHIYISAQILDAQIDQQRMEEEYLSIQRQNAQITWQIAEHTSLDQIRQRAANIGYMGAPRRSYAISPISDDTLAHLDATILANDSRAVNGSPTAANSVNDGLASRPETDSSSQEQAKVVTANASVGGASANRLIENGLIEAIKVIDGR